MRECKAEGCRLILVTKEKMLYEEWPRDVLDEVFALPNDAVREDQGDRHRQYRDGEPDSERRHAGSHEILKLNQRPVQCRNGRLKKSTSKE